MSPTEKKQFGVPLKGLITPRVPETLVTFWVWAVLVVIKQFGLLLANPSENPRIKIDQGCTNLGTGWLWQLQELLPWMAWDLVHPRNPRVSVRPLRCEETRPFSQGCFWEGLLSGVTAATQIARTKSSADP